jgi:hypothetical protein
MNIHEMGTGEFLSKIKEQALQVKNGVQQPIVTDGRRLMVGALDVLCQDPHNLQKFYEAAQEAFDNNPLIFYDAYIKPLIGKATIEPADNQSTEDPAELVRRGLAQLSQLEATVPLSENEEEGNQHEQQPDNLRSVPDGSDHNSSLGLGGHPAEFDPVNRCELQRPELESDPRCQDPGDDS